MTMANVIYDSFTDDIFNQRFNITSATLYGMLVADSYTPSKGSHAKRSDVTGEVAGTGYTAGGAATTVTVAKDTTNHKQTLSFANILWTTSSITARGVVVYNHRGGLASADELVCAGTFGADVATSASTFTAVNTVALTYQN
jgi:hypothetical protein